MSRALIAGRDDSGRQAGDGGRIVRDNVAGSIELAAGVTASGSTVVKRAAADEGGAAEIARLSPVAVCK